MVNSGVDDSENVSEDQVFSQCTCLSLFQFFASICLCLSVLFISICMSVCSFDNQGCANEVMSLSCLFSDCKSLRRTKTPLISAPKCTHTHTAT